MNKHRKYAAVGIVIVFIVILCAAGFAIKTKMDHTLAAVSIIGGADGPTSIFLAGKVGGKAENGGKSEIAGEAEDGGMQELYYRSIVARAYADEQFQSYQTHLNSNWEILETRVVPGQCC